MLKNSSNSGHDHKDPASAKIPAANSANELRATTAAKDARIKEAGLDGNRTGKSTASGKRDQAHRDAKADTIPATSAPSAASPDAAQPETHPIQVQVTTDHNIQGSAKLNLYIEDTVNASLGRFGRQITRFDVHLRDDNANKSNGNDKRCLLEARPAGLQPVAVTAVAATIEGALDDAVDKMASLLESTLGKLHHHKGLTPLGENPTV